MAADTATLRALDLAHVWHPFTPYDTWAASDPVVIERAEGCTLVDTDGNRYLDGVASLWTNVHGHGHPRIAAAIRAQLDAVAHTTLLGLANVPSIALAARLVELAPGGHLRRVFYSDSGSTATEVALKVAFQAQQQWGHAARTRIAAFSDAYHGDTLGSVSAGGIPLFHAVYKPLLFDAVRLPAPTSPDPALEARCLERIDGILDEHGHTIAGFLYEPLVQGAAGMRMHSPAFLARVLRACRDRGILLLADEVATGFGRTGTMFASEQVDVLPDALCLAKGLSGGVLPLAATLFTEVIFDAFRGPADHNRTFFHGHTYTGNPLACAAALASLDVFEDERVLDSLPAKITALRAALAALPAEHVAEVRQKGLMAGVVLRNDDKVPLLGHKVCMAARRHGVILRPLGDTVVVMPPLAMTPAAIATVVEAVGRSLRDTTVRP